MSAFGNVPDAARQPEAILARVVYLAYVLREMSNLQILKVDLQVHCQSFHG